MMLLPVLPMLVLRYLAIEREAEISTFFLKDVLFQVDVEGEDPIELEPAE